MADMGGLPLLKSAQVTPTHSLLKPRGLWPEPVVMHPLAVTTGRINLPLSRRLNLNTFTPIRVDCCAACRDVRLSGCEGSK